MNMDLNSAGLKDFDTAVGQRTLIRLALEKTQEMLIEGKKNNWDGVNKIEAERRLLITKCFDSPIAKNNSEIFAEVLATMLHMNEELVALLNVAKANASVKHGDDHKKYQAVAHYLDID